MQKKARVAPKNIQFKETVQIKEIPDDDADLNNLSRRPSWNPDLTGHDVFKKKPTKQAYVIIGFVICGIVLLCAVIGTVLGVVLNQKASTAADNSLTYNQACTIGSSQCMLSQDLTCPNGFCACTSPYYWNTGSKTCSLLTYQQTCSTSNQCYSSLGLSCTNQICQCDSYHSWSSINNNCVIISNNSLTYGNQCAIGSYQCNSTLDLNCTGNCTCINSKIWNTSSCVCPSGTFLNSTNFCQTLYQVNHACVVGSNQCDSSLGLSCNNSVCQCESTKYWNGAIPACASRVNYSGFCSVDSDCMPTLICPVVSGVCTCPQYLADYLCNCPNTKYYNSSILQCVNRATFNGSCVTSANYTCQVSLYCNAGLCNCPIGTSWIATNSTCA